jgi:valine--pyruvate aminotransferase
MEFSKFTKRFSSHAGIVQLMEDLGAALSGDQNVLMLGGGNPGHIPQVQKIFHERLERILADPEEFAHVIGDYDTPQGEQKFIASLARLLRTESGWDIGPENIVLTAGSQAGFFYLFNMFAGEFSEGANKQIMLPLIPEYIGYADVGLVDNLFVSCRPEIGIIGDHMFKYHVNFSELNVGGNIGALCVSEMCSQMTRYSICSKLPGTGISLLLLTMLTVFHFPILSLPVPVLSGQKIQFIV